MSSWHNSAVRWLIVLVAVATGCFAQSVQNAADVNNGVYTTGLVPGSRAVVDYSLVVANPPSTATVSFLPAKSLSPVSAQVVSVDSSSIGFIVPPELPYGYAELIYKPGNLPTQWTPVTIIPANLSIFRKGTPGPLMALNLTPEADGGYHNNGLTHPAQPGEGVMIWGSGLGSAGVKEMEIMLGGVAQAVLYAGPTPGILGLNQINFQVASATPDGCYVPLVIKYGTLSTTSFLSKTSDGLPCKHPYGFSVSVMKLLDSGASIPVENLNLSSALNVPTSDRASRQESAQIFTTSWNASTLATNATQSVPNTAQCGAIGPAFALSAIFDPGSTTKLTLQNETTSLALPWSTPQPVEVALSSLSAGILTGGNWGLSNQPAFQFTLAPVIQIGGGAPLVVDHTQAKTILWNGTDFDSTALVQLSLTGQGGFPMIRCSAPGSQGSLTIPATLLAPFAAGGVGSLSATLTETGTGAPHYETTSGNGGPSLLLVNWSSSDTRPVDFQ